MKLLPVGAREGSDWEDGLWVERPGYPAVDGSWIHPPPSGCSVPEFEFEEGSDKNKNEPGPVFYVGSGSDCHIRLDDVQMPERVCRLAKEGRVWVLEALLPDPRLHLRDQPLSAGQRIALKDGDVFSLVCPPTPLAYRVHIADEDNWYIDIASEKDYPNKYPGRFPFRSSLADAPAAPEELKRLAWQTDQMRRRSEEDQVRVADWSSFSQYVKRFYYKYGIECTPWASTGRQRPVDPPLPTRAPRAYPAWICDILSRERQLPGMDPARELPFASCLRASGQEVAHPLELLGEPDSARRPRPGPGVPPPPAGPDLATAQPSVAVLPSTPVAEPAGADVPALQLVPEPYGLELNACLRMSFREWLEKLDDSLFLMQYHDNIAAHFDSLAQVHEIYVQGGKLSGGFFEVAGIKKLGHRRIFEKWFRDYSK
mmetsp:Transcript_41391/g.128971  ORF Transcript_41391/g.128971 Transcript_41391/m.128971 type:complete len:427 (+) Transcript_41391:134-1414(+)